jgi:hypothetical protein
LDMPTYRLQRSNTFPGIELLFISPEYRRSEEFMHNRPWRHRGAVLVASHDLLDKNWAAHR